MSFCYTFFENFSFSKEDDVGVPECCLREDAGCCCCCNRKHTCCNNNYYCRAFGRFGYSFFEKHRKFFFGLGSFSSLLCLFLSVYSTAANSHDGNVIQNTYWSGLIVRNSSTSDGFVALLGLQSIQFISCNYRSDGIYPKSCFRSAIRWNSVGCSDDGLGDACSRCKKASLALFWVTIGAVGCHLQSFQDSQLRMRIVADAPAQKFVAILNEMSNSAFIVSSLQLFAQYCETNLGHNFENQGFDTKYWSGPGYICFVFTVVCSFLRLFVQIFTPVPQEEWGFARKKGNEDAPNEA